MIGRDVTRIAIALLLVLSAAVLAAAPDIAAAALLPVLISVVWPLRDGWKATVGTALRPALVWAALAIAAAVAAQVVGWGEPFVGGRPGAGRLTYLANLAALAALVSVLNARAPGGRVWAALMAVLILVFLIPWLEGPWRVRRAGGLTLLHLDAPWTIFYWLLVVVSVTNYLPTRFGTAAGWLALGFLLEYLGLTRDGWPASRRAALWAWSCWTMAAAAWSARWGAGRVPPARTDVEKLWFWFRDLWGVVWALRIQDRFNRTGAFKGWPVRLGWFGLEPAGVPVDVDRGTDVEFTAETPSVVIADPPDAAALFRGLIRRFAQPERIAEVLGPRSDAARLAIPNALADHHEKGVPPS